jgi:carbonic anhydrase
MEMAGVSVSLRNLRTFPRIREKERDGSLKLRGAFFAITDGALHLLDDATGKFAAIA